jgi:hypothetical protein
MCRNGAVCLTGKDVVTLQIQIESKPIAIAKLDSALFIASMDNTLNSFNYQGKKLLSVQMPSEICCLV